MKSEKLAKPTQHLSNMLTIVCSFNVPRPSRTVCHWSSTLKTTATLLRQIRRSTCRLIVKPMHSSAIILKRILKSKIFAISSKRLQIERHC